MTSHMINIIGAANGTCVRELVWYMQHVRLIMPLLILLITLIAFACMSTTRIS